MTLAEAAEIFSYWEQNPPPHLLLQAIARLLGWSPPAAVSPPAAAEIAAAAPPGLAVAHGVDLGLPPSLGADALRDRNRSVAIQIARRNAGKAVR